MVVEGSLHLFDAQVLNNIIGSVAIVLAAGVAIIEARRARKDATATAELRASQRATFVQTAQDVIEEAIHEIDIALHEVGSPSANTFVDLPPIEHRIAPLHQVLAARQMTCPSDGHLAVTLARAVRTMEDLATSKGLGTAPRSITYREFSETRRNELMLRRGQLGTLRVEGSRLNPWEVPSSAPEPG